MITATGRFPEEPLPRLGPEGAEAPEFPVTFSRPSDITGRPDTWPNSFRWFGKGTLRVTERGLLVSAKRRFAIGFHATEQRFVPATEISDVCREGNAVRVDLRGEPRNRDFFQFWTGDTSTAGTIVRLLPTKRTIEYEEPSATVPVPVPVPDRSTPAPPRRRIDRAYALISIGFVVTLIAMGSLITATLLRDRTRGQKPAAPSSSTAVAPRSPVAPPRAVAPPGPTALEIANARLALLRFDDRIDGLHAEFKMAFTALQRGYLTQSVFINGVNTWLRPQWQELYSELASGGQDDQSLDWLVRKRLMTAAVGWDGALREYVRGLEAQDELSVLGALEQMSAANEAQRAAQRLIDREEP